MMEKRDIRFLIIAVGISLALLGGSWAPISALDPSLHIDRYNLEIYTTESGLPQSSVLSIAQTSDGYIWLATYEGLARFDGIRFRVFDTGNTPEIASNRVRVVFEDSGGDLWIGTTGGLLRYSSGAFKNFTVHDGLSSNRVSALCEDRYGGLWVGTTNGLNRMARDDAGGIAFTPFTAKNGFADTYISALAEDQQGTLWIGTSGDGVYFYTNGKFTRGSAKQISTEADIRTLYKDPDGGIWTGIRGRGLVYAPNGSKGEFRAFLTRDGLSGSDVRALFRDSAGTLWIGTNGQGLNTYKNGRFDFSTSEQGFFNSPIRSFLEDREGSLWVGTRDGLSQLKEGKFILYSSRNGLPVDSVRTVFQDNSGNIWLGTVGGGLACYSNGRFQVFGREQGFKSDHIWTISQSSGGDLWVGTYGGGLHRFKNNRVIRIYTTANGLSNNVVRAVYVDPEDNVWVGTNGGGVDVIRLQTGKRNPLITNYSSKNGLSDDFVYAIAGDSQGNTWIGTYYGNLNRFSNGKFTAYGTKDGLTGLPIWSICPDPDAGGRLWLGTDGGGLIRFKNGTITRFTARDGLYSDLAFQVLEDKQGNLWMNCNRGIYSVSKKELEDFAAGKVKRLTSLSFGKKEGIKNTECNGPAQPAGICTTGGALWFPTIRGAVVMDPKKQKVNKVIPPVIIEEMRADGQLIHAYPGRGKGNEGYRLGPGIKRLEFTFTGLSFAAPKQVKFKYRLEGFDDDWMDSGTGRRVSYTNIEPGRYTFRVIAANNDGIWNTTGAGVTFTMGAFFWQTTWFQAIMVVLFAFLSYAGIGFTRNHMKLTAFWKKKKYIASYEIEKQIGAGGMGIVYKVHSLMDKRLRFAMKVMKEEHLLDEVQKKRFKNESLLVDSIDHPHIVKIHERGESTGVLYIVMELLEGCTLAQRYKAEQYLTVDQGVHIMGQIAHILVTLHREDIIHRDLKPENIMLIDRNGDPDYVKLLDFGIARVQSFSRLTETGQVLGTIPYMPPEVLSGGVNSASVDVYSLGIIVYEMLTRKLPFTGDKPLDTMRLILKEEPVEPVKLNRHVPAWLNELVLQMIGKKAEERPDAREVLARVARNAAPPRPLQG